MKKILLVLALACGMQVAFAQKSDADLQKAVDKALAATQDAKKAVKPATWVTLAKAYMAAYANPVANFTTGIDKNTFAMMNKEKPVSVSDVVLDGQAFEKQSFSHVDVYFNAAGVLAIVDVTRQSVPGDLLGLAAEAYAKAFELGGKEKDIDPKLQEIVNDYYNDAFTAYQLGDIAKASKLFKGAADVSVLAPCSVPNDDAAYNTAFTAINLYKIFTHQNQSSLGGRFVIPLAIAAGIGKIGCYLNGCCASCCGIPVQLIESVFQIIAAFSLFLFYRRTKRADLLFPIYLLAYLVMRFLAEFIRTEPRVIGPFTIYHILAVIYIPIVFLVLRRRRRDGVCQ